MKCEKCNCGIDRTYKKMNLCYYHYWIERGRQKDDKTLYYWKEYRYLHPVRVSRWRKADSDFDSFLNEEKSIGDKNE